ncbi:UDP-glucose 4-epimerase GalE [Patescibacteria group bacterium]
MNILVTGGAGYIGSITSGELFKKGHKVVIYDSLENGHDQAVSGLKLVKGNTNDRQKLEKVIRENKIEAVIHFAAYIEMGESYLNPNKYFSNNFCNTLNLLQVLVDEKVKNIVFSSTAGVYGNPKKIPIKENSYKKPENPYGESKLMVEKALTWFDKAHGLKYMILRYFNAAGATLDASLGEDHNPESHLIPNLLKVALGKKDKFVLNGEDYNTPDKTCIRDYVHVLDLASAHILSLEALMQKSESNIYNLGTGKGYSNAQVVDMVKKVTKKDFTVEIGKRRPGDADVLVADADKIQKDLGWKPKYSDLETIVKTAFNWHKSKPLGYVDK